MDAEDRTFEALIEASGVPVGGEEKAELRAAYTTLAALARRTRRPGRGWEARMLPGFVPDPPERKAG